MADDDETTTVVTIGPVTLEPSVTIDAEAGNVDVCIYERMTYRDANGEMHSQEKGTIGDQHVSRTDGGPWETFDHEMTSALAAMLKAGMRGDR